MSLMVSDWISINDVCNVLNLKEKTVKEHCRLGKYSYKINRQGSTSEYLININSLPDYALRKLYNYNNPELLNYSEAPDWAKTQVNKYILVIKAAENLKGNQLKQFLKEWANTDGNCDISYSSFIKMRRRFHEDGINGLLAKYGHSTLKCNIEESIFDYFKNLYLKEGAPSLATCWELTLGYAIRAKNVLKEDFPSPITFKRRLHKEIPLQSIFLARNGQSAWNRKYGGYIERDYSNIKCGKVWVSDHAQIDVACKTEDGKVVFPWVTAWRDYKSGKWLGWLLQSGHPNSDHIFQTFYYAAEEFGLPEDVIIDNGKDYRCKDFAGGRNVTKIKIDTNQSITTSMLAELNVKVHFALPYNAQTKPIERDFLKIKGMLSKHCVGFRGGNIVERPEILAQEIKDDKIMSFEKFKQIFDSFIINVFNRHSSNGKNHNGLSPNELFNQEFTEKITTSRDALKLFCMRTSRNFTIGRNGIQDRELGITYWADWMIRETGLKVYLRRDIKNYKEAWAFKADNNEFVGKVLAVKAVAALHAETISKEEFKEAMAIKKHNLKVTKAYIKQTREISIEEKFENYKAVLSSEEKTARPKVTKIANTNMDKAIRKNKEMEAQGKYDLSQLMSDITIQEDPLYLFETDKVLEEETKGVAYGY